MRNLPSQGAPDVPVAGVVGWPIAHSKSPALHAAWLKHLGLPGHYVPLALDPVHARGALVGLSRSGLRGVNVTVPHKALALELADTASSAARAIGAANLLLFTEEGVYADNTDANGFLYGLKRSSVDVSGKTALVLGAGGAARAVVWALMDAGAAGVTVANRTRCVAEALTRDLTAARAASSQTAPNVTVIDWTSRESAIEDVDVVVNATSIGMGVGAGPEPGSDEPSTIPCSLERAGATGVAYDLVYTPLQTAWLRQARARGLIGVDGLSMLIGQARPSFHAFFGVEPPTQEDLDVRRLLVPDEYTGPS